jgi:ABC-type multidrug transport system permease subunit
MWRNDSTSSFYLIFYFIFILFIYLILDSK